MNSSSADQPADRNRPSAENSMQPQVEDGSTPTHGRARKPAPVEQQSAEEMLLRIEQVRTNLLSWLKSLDTLEEQIRRGERPDMHIESVEQKEDVNLEDIVQNLSEPLEDVKTGKKIEDVMSTVKSNFSSHLLVSFARQANRALLAFITSLYDQRLEKYMAKSSKSADEIAKSHSRKYISSYEMQRRIVSAATGKIFTHYLRDEDSDAHEKITFDLPELIQEIDAEIGMTEPVSHENALESEKNIQRQQHKLLAKIVYNVARDIIVDFAHTKSQELEDGSNLSPSRYIEEHLYIGFEELIRLVTQSATIEAKGMINKDGRGQTSIDIRQIRHDCLGKLTPFVTRSHLIKMSGETFPISSLTESTLQDDVITSEINQALDQYEFEREVLVSGRRGKSMHEKLPQKELEFINDVVVRLAGHDMEGNPLPSPEQDFELFEILEKRLVEWKGPFNTVEFSGHLTLEQRAAIERFHHEGGHVGPMPRKAIEFIYEHGAIFFVQAKVRDDLYATLGSISALSRTPSSAQVGHEKRNDPDHWELSREATGLFPQYDLADIIFPGNLNPSDLKELYGTTDKRLLICRSSILPELSPKILEDQWKHRGLYTKEDIESLGSISLRRLGLAGRLKAELFEVAQRFGSKHLTFNIGTLQEPGQQDLEMVNMPSKKHNEWMNILSWRKLATPIGHHVNMLWRAFSGEIELGMQEFYRKHGLLHGKGWQLEKIQKSAEKHHQIIQRQIQEGKHQPW